MFLHEYFHLEHICVFVLYGGSHCLKRFIFLAMGWVNKSLLICKKYF